MGDLVKKDFEEQVRFLLLQFPSDLLRVAEEAAKLTNRDSVPIEEVRRIRRKFRSEQDKDVSLWVASRLSQKILQGVREREARLEAMYERWSGAEKEKVSMCCGAPVSLHEPMQGDPYYRCLQCDEAKVQVRTVSYLVIEELKMKIIREMRKESELIVKFARDLGFTAAGHQEPATVQRTSNFVFVGSQQQSSPNHPISVDAEGAKKLEGMSPIERERVIKQLEAMSRKNEDIVDTEFVPNSEDVVDDSEESKQG